VTTMHAGPHNSLPDPIDNFSDPAADTHLHFAALVNSSRDPIISKDLTGRILSWNRAAVRVFGYEEEEILGQSMLRVVSPNFHQEETELQRKLKAGEPIDPYETTWVRKDGRNIPVSVIVYPVRNESGNVIGASKIATDISQRQLDDESRFQLAAIVASADDAIVSKDLTGIVTSWNEGAQRMFGFAAEEMVGQSILHIIPEELRYEEDEILRKLRAGERIDHYETTRRKKSGEHVHVSVTISPIRNATGQVIGASKIARDISDRKKLERLLIQSEKLAATGRMAATIAHEINNPLEAVMNLIFLARQQSPESGKAYHYLLTAEQELERVSHIARQTLGYYKDTGAPVELLLHQLIENVLAVYNSRLTALGITVDLRFNDLQAISASRGEMLQVFSNVIANALDAMPKGGSLEISTRKLTGSAGDGIQIAVRDSGAGIQREHLERIFEAFFTTKGNLGTGIGLWVARQLVEKRGGHISVASSIEPDKSGTTITIFVPFTAPGSHLLAEQA
jgi:PAS domain S-box-containing protein